MSLSEKIVELLAVNESLKAVEIAEKLGEDKKLVDKELKALKEAGKITSPKRCYYSVG